MEIPSPKFIVFHFKEPASFFVGSQWQSIGVNSPSSPWWWLTQQFANCSGGFTIFPLTCITSFGFVMGSIEFTLFNTLTQCHRRAIWSHCNFVPWRELRCQGGGCPHPESQSLVCWLCNAHEMPCHQKVDHQHNDSWSLPHWSWRVAQTSQFLWGILPW